MKTFEIYIMCVFYFRNNLCLEIECNTINFDLLSIIFTTITSFSSECYLSVNQTAFRGRIESKFYVLQHESLIRPISYEESKDEIYLLFYKV